ncbi:sensor domain-containing diguanylate cyclase [Pseudoroseicyclus tamaricis]|uniref:Sensor domain-containing diguanylate cyclase n=1 Tax=Pseudoroseicyclus tamaricis TaxID=2705421 RepID=A0A6B2JK50_9RHOB|nr:sensor domain-containing diguanylate cyclase [Pseudoroseicyclus tamaricis]NDV01823.1 sensor domain-containing diguanylate cyclase [Pseudoroseicyclus tamaricis]
MPRTARSTFNSAREPAPLEPDVFDLAPIAMWLEDYSAVIAQFDAWREEGITDIRAFLGEDPRRAKACAEKIRVLQVNAATLKLFGARDQDELVANMPVIFHDEMMRTHIEELSQLWSGGTRFSSVTTNYTLDGRRLDIKLRGNALPGHEATMDRVLVTTEDITDTADARRQAVQKELEAQGIFEHSPVSLWIEDFSRIRHLLEGLRQRGISDLRVFLDVHPEFIRQCMAEIRVLDINQATLTMFGAPDKSTLLHSQHLIFRGDFENHFREQLIELWQGNLFHSREVVNYALDGSERFVIMQFSVLPGHQGSWSRVQVALTDITARKKAEAYLEYLGKHDVLTGLRNRAYHIEAVNRLERMSVRPVSVLIVDLNGLKTINDTMGHDTGDGLLRRLGEVLSEAAGEEGSAARIGGDEFAVLLPNVGRSASMTTMETIDRLVKLNNQYYSHMPQLQLAIGHATIRDGETLEATIRRADERMYTQKREYYAAEIKGEKKSVA